MALQVKAVFDCIDSVGDSNTQLVPGAPARTTRQQRGEAGPTRPATHARKSLSGRNAHPPASASTGPSTPKGPGWPGSRLNGPSPGS
jgi:hypothetical protein